MARDAGVRAQFLTTQAWDPNKQLFGAATFIVGTAVTSFGALLLAGRSRSRSRSS